MIIIGIFVNPIVTKIFQNAIAKDNFIIEKKKKKNDQSISNQFEE